MKLKILLKAFVIFAKQSIFTNRKQFIKSYVSLFIVMSILVTATFAWFTVRNTAEITSNEFKLQSSSSLNVSDKQTISNHILIESVKLDEAGSIDGRNIYFPTTGSDSDSAAIEDLKFREATVGDQNKRYVYTDFTLHGSNASNTNVYLKSFEIKVKYANGVTVRLPDGSNRSVTASNPFEEVYNGSTEIKYTGTTPTDIARLTQCPIRVAFIDNSQNDPVVIDPTAMVSHYAQDFCTVSGTNADGTAHTKISDADAFSDYYYLTGTPIYTIRGNTPLNGTMVAWLEGASDRSDELRNAEITIDVELESVFPEKSDIYFIDNTWGDGGEQSHWVIDSNRDTIVTVTYVDGKDNNDQDNVRTVVMKKIADINGYPAWWAPIPKSVRTNITFNRYDLTSETIFNAWYTRPDVMSLTDFYKDGSFNTSSKIKGFLNKKNSGTSASSYVLLDTTRDHPGVTDDPNPYCVYTALRGNGYGSTNDTKERLSPCVGYWSDNITAHDYKNSQNDDTSGGSSGEDIGSENVTIEINIEAYDQGQCSSWASFLAADLQRDYDMYVIFEDGSKLKLTYNQQDSKLMLPSTSIARGKTIKGFQECKKSNPSETKDLITIKPNSATITLIRNFKFNFSFRDSNWRLITWDNASYY